MKEFQNKYKSFSNHELLQILENADNYQAIAVEAAKLELSTRDINEEELQSVQEDILDKKIKTKQREERVEYLKTQAKGIGSDFFATVHPVQKGPQTIDRRIKLMVIVFGLLAIYRLFQEFGMLEYMIASGPAEWDFSTFLYIAPLIVLPIGVFLFWQRKKTGWILLSVLFVYEIVNAIGTFFLSQQWNDVEYPTVNSTGGLQIELKPIEGLLPQPNPIFYLIVIAFFGAALWVLNKEVLRAKFQISAKSRLLTIGISTLVAVAILMLLG